jgi:hypothetical protein
VTEWLHYLIEWFAYLYWLRFDSLTEDAIALVIGVLR